MTKPKPMSEKEIRAAMDRASGLIYGCDEFVIDAARYALAAIGADNLRLRAEVASWTAAHAAMVRERDARIVPGRCLAQGDAQRPDGPRCENVGEFKCFDCRGWLCRDHAPWHFDGERAGLRANVERLTRELRDARSRILSDEERAKLTGDALHAEAEADRLRARVAWLTKELSGGSSPEPDGYIPQTELEKVRLGAIGKMDGGDA